MGDRKTYILDTNVLIHDPGSIYQFQENEIVIPFEVLEDGLYQRIFITKPVIPVGRQDIGFLPVDKEDKMLPERKVQQ